MEVSQLASLDTHAVIGGEDPQAFGINDDAEMYEMLSSALYRDKQRAAMRETICNGWDAHIVTGRTDIPLEITLTDDEIVIKDFGPGIPHEKIKPIYCIYGKSTKVKDENQTGGFGLGSKSPFAVSDHFSAVSCYEGTRSVYAISRGGKATQGKPDCRRMVAVPTTETGMTVTIPLRDKKERYSFEQHIRAVVYQGGMLAKLNGQLLDRLDYTEARKTEYCVVPLTLRESKVYVLYGTVLYPLTTTDEHLVELARLASDHIIGKNTRLILIAPPNSVGVTPSRESLSYTEITNATLERLLLKARRQILAAIPAAANRFLRAWVKEKGITGITSYVSSENVSPQGMLSTPADIADHAVKTETENLIPQVNKRKYKAAVTVLRDDRRFFRRAMAVPGSVAGHIFRRQSQPALRIASKMGLLKDLYAFKAYDHYRENSGPKTVPFKQLEGEGCFMPKICVARNLRDLRPTFSQNSGATYNTPKDTYIAGFVLRAWTEKNLKELRALCARFKVRLIEFDYEEAQRNRAAMKPVRRVKTEDVFLALESFTHNGVSKAEFATCKEPAAYLMASQRLGTYTAPFGGWCIDDLRKRYPNTVIVTTKSETEKLEKLGVKNLTFALAGRLTELSALREVQYGFAIWQGNIATSSETDDVGYVARKLSQAEFRFAKILFPDKAEPGEAFKEAALLYNVLLGLTGQSDEASAARVKAIDALATASAATFPKLSKEATARKFRYLAILRGADVIDDMTYQLRNELFETVKFLQRHHSKSKLTVKSVAADAVETAHKEAA